MKNWKEAARRRKRVLTIWLFRDRSTIGRVRKLEAWRALADLHNEFDGQNQPDDGKIDMEKVQLRICQPARSNHFEIWTGNVPMTSSH